MVIWAVVSLMEPKTPLKKLVAMSSPYVFILEVHQLMAAIKPTEIRYADLRPYLTARGTKKMQPTARPAS
jgi:hypothetical protein